VTLASHASVAGLPTWRRRTRLLGTHHPSPAVARLLLLLLSSSSSSSSSVHEASNTSQL